MQESLKFLSSTTLFFLTTLSFLKRLGKLNKNITNNNERSCDFLR